MGLIAIDSIGQPKLKDITEEVLLMPTGTWVRATSAGDRQWSCISISDNGRIVATSYDDGVYMSSNWGQDWEQVLSGSSWTNCIITPDGSKIIASKGVVSTTMSRSVDFGATWSSFGPTNYWRDMSCTSDGSVVYVIGKTLNGYVYRTRDAGETWMQVPFSSSWVGGSSNNNFMNWMSVDTSQQEQHTICSSWPNGRPGSVFIDSNNNTKDPIGDWRATAISANGMKMAVCGDPASVYTSINSGATWVERTGVGIGTKSSIAIFDNTIAVCVSGGAILTSTNFGANWTTETAVGTALWGSVAFSSNGAALVACAGWETSGPQDQYIWIKWLA